MSLSLQINALTGTSEIIVKVNGNETLFNNSSSDGQITISEVVAPITFPKDDYRRIAYGLSAWLEFITQIIGVSQTVPRADFDESMVKKNGKITCIFKHINTIIIHSIYDNSTGLVTIKPRPLTTLPFTSYRGLVLFHRRCVDEILNF